MASNSSAVTITVNALAATTTTLTASPTTAATGTTVSFTAMVTAATGSPTGTVTFLDGTTPLGTATLSSGKAGYSTTSLAGGTHSITAAYGGDANDASSVSSAVTLAITVPTPGFSLSLNPSSGSIAATGSTTTTLTITPVNGFNQTVSFKCTGLPAQATCTFAPATVTPSGAPATTMVTIAAGANASLVHPTGPTGNGKLPLAFAGVVLGLAFLRDHRRLRSRLLSCIAMCALGAGLLGIGSCASGSGGGGMAPPATTTTTAPASTTGSVSITATSGSIVQSTPYTLTMQ